MTNFPDIYHTFFAPFLTKPASHVHTIFYFWLRLTIVFVIYISWVLKRLDPNKTSNSSASYSDQCYRWLGCYVLGKYGSKRVNNECWILYHICVNKYKGTPLQCFLLFISMSCFIKSKKCLWERERERERETQSNSDNNYINYSCSINSWKI